MFAFDFNALYIYFFKHLFWYLNISPINLILHNHMNYSVCFNRSYTDRNVKCINENPVCKFKFHQTPNHPPNQISHKNIYKLYFACLNMLYIGRNVKRIKGSSCVLQVTIYTTYIVCHILNFTKRQTKLSCGLQVTIYTAHAAFRIPNFTTPPTN